MDILLTNDWPKGITNLTKPLAEVDDLTVGSPLVSRLALLSRSAKLSNYFNLRHFPHFDNFSWPQTPVSLRRPRVALLREVSL